MSTALIGGGENGTIVIETPERPAGQKSVLGLTVPKMEVVRVGIRRTGHARSSVRWNVSRIYRNTSRGTL